MKTYKQILLEEIKGFNTSTPVQKRRSLRALAQLALRQKLN